MAQHDMNIANQGFPAFRADLNDALGALVSNSSGATAPATTFAHQFWVDTAADPSVLKIRNADNDAWITIGSINQTDDKFKLTPADGISTDTISELTSAAGVTVDGVLLKDSGVGSAASPVSLNSLNYPTEGSVNFRNRIINGDMRIDARNAGASVSIDGGASYTLDRYLCQDNTDGSFSVQQSTTAPTGFVNSLLVTITGTDSSLTTTQFGRVVQRIEGTNISDLAWGSASAKTVTLSFWVRSSVTGTFGGSLTNSDANRIYAFTYTISSANTFEYKTISIAGDTTGTWLTTTATGIEVNFGLGAGPDRSVAAGSWGTSLAFNATGATNLFATNGATWYITGVQLEVGSVATPFERRPFTTELQLCYRYYYKQKAVAQFDTFGAGLCDTTTACQAITPFPVLMRVSPTALEQSGTAGDYLLRTANANPTCSAVPTFSVASPFSAAYNFIVASGLTAGQAIFARGNNTSAFLAWSAEL